MPSSYLTHILLHLMASYQQNLGLRQSHEAMGTAAGQPMQKHYLPHPHALLSMHHGIHHGQQTVYVALLPLTMLHTCPSTVSSTLNQPAWTHTCSKYCEAPHAQKVIKKRNCIWPCHTCIWGVKNSTSSTSRHLHLKKGQKVGESMLPHKHVCFISCLNAKSLPFSRQTPLGHIFQLC